MESLIGAAIDKERNEDYTFFLSGDLNQMSIQKSFLNNIGIETKQNDVYPCVKEVDKSAALKAIWDNRVEGWWHYKDEYVKYSICTEKEFKDR